MTTPKVACICLTADRHEMTNRAVQCFLSQTYHPSVMIIYDTGKKRYLLERLSSSRIVLVYDGPEQARTIGAMRNIANSLAGPTADVFAHWDSDDWSHPNRLTDQVALLTSSGMQACGYREMLFWRYPEAWIYRHASGKFCIGTSLMYWRSTWTQKPFQETSAGEDFHFQRNMKTAAKTCFCLSRATQKAEPLMIAQLHGGNTHARIDQSETVNQHEWKREPGWDARVQELMKL